MFRRALILTATVLVAACSTPARPLPPVPVEAPSLLQAADRLRRSGDLDAAANLYGQFLERSPGSVRGHAGLQEVRRLQGLELDVRRTYRNAAPYLRGRLEADGRKQQSLYADAAEPFRSVGLGRLERARALDAGHSWTRVALGRDYLDEGKLGLAEYEFRAALWTEPGHPAASYGLSAVYNRRGQHRLALLWSRRAYEAGRVHEALAERLYTLAGRGGAEARQRAAASLGSGDAKACLLAGKLGDPRAGVYMQRARELGASEREIDAERKRRPPKPVREFVRRFSRSVRGRYRHYAATGQAEELGEFLEWARALYTETTGRKLGRRGTIREFDFVGAMVDPSVESDEPLVRECAKHGLLLLIGQRSGGPPEAMLAEIVRREPARAITSRGVTVPREAVWTRSRYVPGYREWAGRGEVAGLALWRFLIIDEDAIARWEGDIRRTKRRLAPYREQVLAQEAVEGDDPVAVNDPAGVAERLRLVGKAAVADEVRIHEDAHVVDAELHLPVGDHLLRNLGLALSSGFSSLNIQARLERNAQVTAVAEGKAPLSALATCCGALGGTGPHALGYTEIVEAMVRMIARHPERYPEIDTERVIVQQLQRLSAKQVRTLAKELMERWGLVER